MDSFANNLRTRAEELGISNAEAARRANLSERRYGNYVSGRREPDLATLVRIAQVLETTPNMLLGFETAPIDDTLRSKINSAVSVLEESDKEVVAACAEAIVKLRAR
tara:strand:- start:33 stop:353 length:321 start_codon:yes stop_codon:yes gene_type:complete